MSGQNGLIVHKIPFCVLPSENVQTSIKEWLRYVLEPYVKKVSALKRDMVGAYAVVTTLLACATTAYAQESSTKPLSGQYAEIYKHSQIWNNQASLDTAPILFSIGDVKYKVPRNYIVWMDHWNGGPQTLVRFKVTYPKFEPLDEKNAPCLTLAPVYRPPGCVPLEFIVANGGQSAGGGGWAVSDEVAFNNFRDLFHSQTPLPGPYGFELYETGPENALIATYRKRTPEHLLIMQCLFHDSDRRATATCDNHSRLADHNELEFLLYFDQLQSAEEIDQGFRSLVASFTVTEK
jgi:hypothetical protein